VVFTDEGGGLATIEFTPDFTMAPQTINIQVIADDGRSQDTVVVPIVVADAGPQAPTINPVADKTVTELHTLTFTVETTDIDAVEGEFPILTSSPLPGAATYTDNSDGTGTFNWETTTDDAGSYPVTFYATDAIDAALIDSLTMNITVVDTNRAPRGIISGTLYSPLGTTSKTTYEGDSLIFYVQALDPDGTIPSIHAIMSTYWDGTNQEPTRSDTLYPNMVMVDSGNGYAQLEFRPSYAQGGPAPAGIDYLINFYLVDAVDPTLITAFPAANVPFKVLNVNAPPVIYLPSGPGPFSVSEGASLQFRIYGTDSVDNQTSSVVLTGFNLPARTTFDGPAANVKDFRFSPDFTQAGTYQVGFVATDAAGAADTALVTINVIEAGNQNPDWLTVLDQSIAVPKSTGITIPLSSVDPDGDPLTLSVSRTDIPDGTLIDNGDGTGSYEFTAATAITGSFYLLSFYTTDPDGASDTLTTILQVVSFLRGDIDLNNRYTMNDLADLISYVYREGPEPQIWEAGDVNADGAVNLVDISYLIRFLYHGGPPPPPPGN
jgi:hypothetical protein